MLDAYIDVAILMKRGTFKPTQLAVVPSSVSGLLSQPGHVDSSGKPGVEADLLWHP